MTRLSLWVLTITAAPQPYGRPAPNGRSRPCQAANSINRPLFAILRCAYENASILSPILNATVTNAGQDARLSRDLSA